MIAGRTKSTYITKIFTPKPNESDSRVDKISDGNVNVSEMITNLDVGKFFELSAVDISRESTNNTATEDICYTLYIAEDRRHECPKLSIKVLEQEILAIIDTGCELSIMNEHLYNRLRHRGLKCLELPTQHVNLISAFNKKSNRVRKQAMLEVEIGGYGVSQIVLLSPQLLTEAILGLDFLVNHEAIINFAGQSITLRMNGEDVKFQFIGVKQATGEFEDSSSEGQFCNFRLRPSFPRRSPQPTAVSCQYPTKSVVARRDDTLFGNEKQGTSVRIREAEQHIGNRVELVIPRPGDRDEPVEFISKHGVGSREFSTDKVDTLATDKDGHIADNYGAARHEVNKECRENLIAANRRPLCSTATCHETNDVKKSNAQQGLKTGHRKDDRMVTAEQLLGKVKETNNLSPEQQGELYKVLINYQPHLTKRPGRCTVFEYEFIVEGSTPASASARPIPFSLRKQVHEQIKLMLKDDTLEESFSSYLNPLTLVVREDKPIRICVDARRINKQMIADRTKVLPLRELIQKFHGASYITSLDLSSAFLQVPLKETSRKWTAFQFQGKVYQFKAVPYGFKNSLSAFIRALEKVLGDHEINNNLVMYVDDLLIHSATFDDHLKHINVVLHKLTNAGFTINAAKCQFCQPEVKFLGHIISNETVRPDPERVEAILKYPAPKNQRQLRKFLGVCNFHQQFIVNYASYVEPLLVLLRKGNRWRWTTELQKSFENLRSKFAESIYLVHPDEGKSWIINTDASGKAIGSVLMQQGEGENLNIISTASRVLKPAEQRYTTCEKELLAVIYALQHFKIYIYGRKVILFTDNQAITFLQKCVITSNRVARWMMEIQQYDIEIRHIKGVQNYLADVLSRSPRGLTEEETKSLTRPDQIMVTKIQVYEDKTLRKELQKLAILQDADERIAAIKGKVMSHSSTVKDRYNLQENVLYSRDDKTQHRWRVLLPDNLESRIFKYVHLSLGHVGVDKCLEEIKCCFHVRNLGRKLRKFIACCDVCQKTKHPNRSVDIEEKHHLPKKPGDVCALDIYGRLPTSRGGVKYILVCLDVFAKYIKLYSLKSATTKSCLNKLVNHYFGNVITPKIILSDNGTQFRSPAWGKQLQKHGVETRFTPIRHPESNPSERYMRELSKFCRIYCNENHKKWAEILPYIENWINNTVASATGYTPTELMYGSKRCSVLNKIMPSLPALDREDEGIDKKLEKAYSKMRKRAEARGKRRKRGNVTWAPKVNDKVLVKQQPMSEAVKGITSKFMYVYEGPFWVNKVLDHSAYELKDERGKVRGEFNKRQLKPYREEKEDKK